MSIVNKLNKFIKLSTCDKKLFFEALLFLIKYSIALKILPFKKIAARIKKESCDNSIPTENQKQNPKNIGRAVIRAANHVPWKALCLHQAIIAKIMLNKRNIPSTLYFGCMRDESRDFKAHAWLKSNDIFITGKAGHQLYTVVSSIS